MATARARPVRVAIHGIGVLGPGLPDWHSALPLLREPSAWRPEPTVVPTAARLPPTERRRAGTVVKAALVVADAACAAAGLEASQLGTVFTSSTGDPLNCHLLCEALASTERVISPTRFTNSVHNAPAGYWHIAAQSRRASTSLAAFDASFGAGLLEAAVQCVSSAEPVLLVACDVPYPEPLHRVRPLTDVFAVALVLVPDAAAPGLAAAPGSTLYATPRAAPLLCLQDAAAASAATRCSHAGFEALRIGIPAARSLPLLCALASPDTGTLLAIEDVPGRVLNWRLTHPGR